MREQDYPAMVKLAQAAKKHNIYRIYVRCDGVVQDGQYTSTWRIQCYTPIEVSAQSYSLTFAVQAFIASLEANTRQPAESHIQLLLSEDKQGE